MAKAMGVGTIQGCKIGAAHRSTNVKPAGAMQVVT